MYRVIFTSDYEIHGSGMGSPRQLIVEPTDRALDQFDRFGAKLTIMADVCEILKFQEYEKTTGKDRFFFQAIKRQMERAITSEHDVQLHFHSSYANATWDEGGGCWTQDYAEYHLASLGYERIKKLIGTGKRFLEETLRPVKPGYECFVFRAPHWSMHPSPNIVRALVENGIRIDTSVWKFGRYDALAHFDYTKAHSDLVPWPVSETDVCKRDPDGRLFEFPIYSEERPIWTFLTPNRVYRVIAQRLNPLPNPDAMNDATSGGGGAPKKAGLASKLNEAVSSLVRQHPWKMDFNQCTGKQLIDGLRRVEARYGHPQQPLPIVLIGHSKTFTRHNERSLRSFLEFVRSHPTRFSFGTFGDFEPEQFRAATAA